MPSLGAARRHWAFVLLLASGAGLRAVALLAYRPALIYPDSRWYLETAGALHPSTYRPIGYPVFLALLPLRDGLAVVPFAQHLLALATAVLLYALLVHLGV